MHYSKPTDLQSALAALAAGARPLAGGTLSGKVTADGRAPPGSRHVQFPHFQPRYYSAGNPTPKR